MTKRSFLAHASTFLLLLGLPLVTQAGRNLCIQPNELLSRPIDSLPLTTERERTLMALDCPSLHPVYKAYLYYRLGAIEERLGNAGTALESYHRAFILLPSDQIIREKLQSILIRQTDSIHTLTTNKFAKAPEPERLVQSLSIDKHLETARLYRRIALEYHQQKPADCPPPAAQPTGSGPSKPEPHSFSSLPTAIIFFPINSSCLTAGAQRTLDAIHAALNNPSLANYRFRIEGHTCSLGPADYNLRLSAKRAESVRDWLIQRGIPASRLFAYGYGEAHPLFSNQYETTRALNRRVQITTVGVDLPQTSARSAPRAKALLDRAAESIAAGDCPAARKYLQEAEEYAETYGTPELFRTLEANKTLLEFCTTHHP